MDHYKTLGLSRSASKEEIKDAFRKSALKFHPDRHSQSPKEVRDGASLKFKQASEAYEVLIDDRKRADYDFFTRRSSSSSSYSRAYGGGGYGGSSGNYYRAPPRRDVRGGAGGFDFAGVFQHITRRGFLVNLAFASALFGGAVVIERTVQNLWKVNNSGKSFEDTLQTIEKHRRAKTENN